ncbi:MAG: copper chaperone PCu(A)C [Nocardioides sp.]|uniref:copper chaperone PCu(A)C n=1 Tax=Nocardioides sp. TaxID=35761 RepID=UPI003F0E1CA9
MRTRTTPAHRAVTRARRAATAALAVALGLGLAACGDDAGPTKADETTQADQVTIEDPWVRATEGSKDTSMTAAFMVITNEGTEEVTLVGADTEVAGRTEIHEMVEIDGEMAMQAIEGGLVLAADRGQVLQPGGNHIMLMEVSTALKAGDEVALTLEFDDGSTRELTVPVKPFTEETGHYHEPGTDADHEH